MDLSQFGSIDPQILKILQDAYAANPSLRVSNGESNAGPMWSIDPASRQGDFYLNLDEQGRPLIYKDLERNTWGQDSALAYDMTGNPVGLSSGDSTALGLLKFALASAAAYGGVNALGGGAGAAGGAASATPEMANGAFLCEGVASGIPAWDSAAMSSALGSGQLGTAGSYFAQNPASSLGMGTSTVGSALGNAATNAVKGAASNGSLLGAGLGAVAGALDSKDQEQTQTREPWAEAQPFLKQLLGQGSQLATQYQQQPFSQAQRTAYGNMGGLLDSINASAPGLLNQMGQVQQFQRGGQPTTRQVGMPLNWQAGLLGNFGTRG